MKKVFTVVAVAAMCVASSWAAVVTNVTDTYDITIKGKLSPAKTAVTEATLAGGTNAVSWMALEIVTEATETPVAATTNIVSTGQTLTIGTGCSTNVSTNEANGVITTTYTSTTATSTNLLVGSGWVVTITTVGTNTTAASTNNIDVIGQYVDTTNAVVYLEQTSAVDLTPKATEFQPDKFVDVFEGTHGTATNAVLLLSGTTKTTVKSSVTNTTVSAKVQGTWNASTTNTVAGTLKGN